MCLADGGRYGSKKGFESDRLKDTRHDRGESKRVVIGTEEK